VVRGCARKCRNFQRAYLLAHAEKGDLDLSSGLSVEALKACVDTVSYAKLQKMQRDFKTHRSVADINISEVRMIVAEAEN
jgi:hypothetical protein